ncbi:hypothetical protein CDAR_123101 [Caerostris darwini]|uniref:Uncharacterized protein n=1 Tax=Caerostris darwini TaxID=1538125 RepID=A0AAV4X8H4_9ARAC|nr:hypothetical protein CDAR_123101 [Caerostris darwini]
MDNHQRWSWIVCVLCVCVPLCHSETRIFTAGVWDGTGEENEYFYASNRNSILDTPASRNDVAIFNEMYAPTHEIGLSKWRKHHRLTIASKKVDEVVSSDVYDSFCWYFFGMNDSSFLSDSVNISMQHAVKFSNMYAI